MIRASDAIRRAVLVAVAASVVIVAAACSGVDAGASGSGAGSVASSADVTLNVAAAASLRTAIEQLTGAYSTANPGVGFTVTTDSSAALRAQVEQGAPIDVFLSADTRNPQALVDQGLAAGPPVPFAANSVALVVPADNPARIASPADLATPGVRLIGAADSVPIATYAAAVIANLARLQPDPEGWAQAVEANIVSREQNVAAVLARIELGEGDAGFVYATDAAAGDRVDTLPIPEGANVRATYAGVVPESSPHRDAAASFLAWVAGPGGQAVLAPLGFVSP